ncbi:MAG: hypothetical protein JWM78_1055 [Verrucomicrobiaceae bacterium]|nr:hypothetical protein [Verrucomicrobiaceae bacterium]
MSQSPVPVAEVNSLVEALLAPLTIPSDDLAQLRPGVTAAVQALLEERPRLSEEGFARGKALFEDNLRRLQEIYTERERHPEIADVKIERPIFILGLPRCGTSLLHALMSVDPDTRTPLSWEVAQPSPPPEAATFDTDPRIAAFDRYVDEAFAGEWAGVRKAHPVGAVIPQECGMIMETAFTSANPVMMFRLPSFYKWYQQADTTFGYQVHKKWLQHLAWHNPRKRWVLKVQEHMYHLPELLSVYPDAILIQPHRDPLTVMASISELIRVIRSIGYPTQDPIELGQEMLHLWHDGQVKLMAYRKAHPELKIFDMRYKDIAANPVEAARSVYAYSGAEFTPLAEKNMRQWLADNPSDKHGRHTYSLDDFGLTETQIKAVYSDYIETYGAYL